MKKLAIALVAFACLYSTAADARRLPWCGIYMGKYFGMSDRSLWVARNWASVGTAASGPGEGVVVVWRHHVGVIVGRDSSGEWLVHSGNDGNAVRTRPRSLRGAIAFRHVGAGSSAYANLKVQEKAARGRNQHLVALAVEGRHSPRTALQQSRTRARGTVETVIVSGFPTTAFAAEANPTREIFTKQRKPMSKRQRMLVGADGTMPNTVVSGFGEPAQVISHNAPRTRSGRVAAFHPSSQAWPQSFGYRPPDTAWLGNAVRGRGVDAGAARRAYRRGPF